MGKAVLKIGSLLIIVGLMAFPAWGSDNNTGKIGDNFMLSAKGGHGPGDGSGNGGSGPKDGTGNGSRGGCLSPDAVYDIDYLLILARGGHGGGNGSGNGGGGNGGHGPGDGSGNGGSGPKDGTGHGSKSGTCVNS